MDANKLKAGNKILVDGEPYKVIDATRRQQPRMAAKVIIKTTHLITGSNIEKTFTSGDEVREANIERIAAQYIYNDGADNYIFMDLETSEQFEINKASLGDIVKYLIEGTDVTVVRFEEKPIDVEIPLSMVMTISETEPAIKGDSVNNVMKPATLENGYTVQVPLFVNSGDKIIINTETGEYKGRSKD